MSFRIKFLIASMAGIAAFSVFSFWESLSLSARIFNPVLGRSTVSLDIDQDIDKDGLTNREESYWNTDFQNPDTDGDGFLDGEEVASGHNPTKAGPDDKLLPPGNITERVSELVLSGIYEGSLRLNSPDFDKSIDQITDDLLLKSYANTYEPRKEASSVPDTEKNIKSYKDQMRPRIYSLAKDNSQGFLDFIDALNKIDITKNPEDKNLITIIEREVLKTNSQLEDLAQINVPVKWSAKHIELLILIKSINKNYSLIGQAKRDPLQSLISMNNLSTLILDDLPNITFYYMDNILK